MTVITPIKRDPALLHRSLHERPTVVTSGSGVFLNLDDGRRILDGCAGAAVAIIGHGNSEVTEAVVKQMNQISYTHTLSYTTDSAEDLAEFLIAKGRPFGLTKAYFIGSGSEAMDSALKMARQYHVENKQPQRKKLVARQMAYHGNTIGPMSVGSNKGRRAPYEDALLLDCVSFVSPTYAYRDQGDGETEEAYASRLVDELEQEFISLGPETVSAFIAETVGGATSGCVTPPRGYFKGVRRICNKYGILLILDEVMCGLGRTGSYFAFETEDVTPDLLTMGKHLGGGYAPVASLLVSEKLISVLRNGTGSFVHGHTYQAHPVSCAASLAVQRIVFREGLVEQCAAKGKLLEAMLRSELGGQHFVGNIRGRGLFWGIEFVEDKETKRSFAKDVGFATSVQKECLRRDVAVYPGFGDFVMLAPPLTITELEMETMVDTLVEAYKTVESWVL